MSEAVAVEVESLVKRYRAGMERCVATVDALRGVELQVGAGELVAVVGPPGAGKSTLLLCVAGLLRPDEGRVVWFGRRRSSHAPPPGIGFAPEHAVHYSFLTVRESLEYYATLQDLPGAGRRIDEALARSALGAQARSRVARLDRAARQRLAMARALLGQPRLLILDAPLAGLDRDARHDTRKILRELRGGGITVLVSAREAWELEGLATRIVTLVGGRVRAELRWPPSGASIGMPGAARPFVGGGLVAEHLS